MSDRDEPLDRGADPRRVEAVRRAMLRRLAVVTELRVRHAEGEQAVRAIFQRARDLGRRGAGEIRLDEDDVGASERSAELLGRERTDRGEVADGHVEIRGCYERRRQ